MRTRLLMIGVLCLAACGSSTGTSHTFTMVVFGNGRVQSSKGGLDCPGTCTLSYTGDADFDLTATPGPNSFLFPWTGDCQFQGTALTVHVTEKDQDGACELTFGVRTTLTVTPSTQTISAPQGGTAPDGQADITVTGTDAGLAGWQVTASSPPGNWLKLLQFGGVVTTITGNGTSQFRWKRDLTGLPPGTHTATLTIAFSPGAVQNPTAGSPATITDIVQVTAPVSVTIAPRVPSGVALVGATVVSFTANLTNPPAGTTLTWDFGDGSPTATGTTVQHRFDTDPGQGAINALTVRVTAKNGSGATVATDAITENTQSLLGTWTLYDNPTTPHVPAETTTITSYSGATGLFSGTNAVAGTTTRPVTGSVTDPFGVGWTRWTTVANDACTEKQVLVANSTGTQLSGNKVNCVNVVGAATLWIRN